jgi:glycosyltransferase involved in cell wall biosynthesis
VGNFGPPSILHVGTLPPHHGGSAHASARILAGLAGLGHEIEAIAPITESEVRGGDHFAEQSSWLHLTRYVVPHFYMSPDIPAAPEYLELEREQVVELVGRSLERQMPDVLIAGRESFAPYLAGTFDIPSVVLIQGSTTAGILNGTYPEDLAETMLWSLRQFDLLVTCAPHMRRRVARLGLDVEVVPNPVDLERFHPGPGSAATRRALDIGEDDIVVTHPSNLKALKRPLDVVDAAEIALREDARLLFVVAGDGPYWRPMKDAAAERGLTSRFRFPGWIDHDLVPDVIRCSDIVVLPSASEAQALAYLETQATGRVLVASDIPAAREVIEDGKSGLMFPTGNVDELAARILLCARDPDLRARLGGNARRRVAHHSVHRVGAAYSRLLISLLERMASSAASQGTMPTSA